MKITFLGTSAAPGIPLTFCECNTCDHARIHKGKNIRKRASYVINNDLLVDLTCLPPALYWGFHYLISSMHWLHIVMLIISLFPI